MDSCCALPMNEQVFTTMMSASSASGVSSAPAWVSMPIMTSLSTRFLGQPRLTKPTLAGAASPEIADMVFFKGTRISNDQRKQIDTILASNVAMSAAAGRRTTGAKEGVSFPPIRVAVLILWNKNASLNAPEARCRLNGSQF
jgi:hypothetical protein